LATSAGRQFTVDYQRALAGLDGIDLILAQWLHLTMQNIDFTDEINADELGHSDHALTAALAAVEFRYLTIQRQAVHLKAHPAAALSPLHRTTHGAVLSVLGSERFARPQPTSPSFCRTSASATSPTMVTPDRS
jgi:hypothetical protein